MEDLANAWPASPVEVLRDRQSIVVVDLVESVRLVQVDEATTVSRWRELVRAIRQQAVEPMGGKVVKSLGDGLLLSFGAPHLAVEAAALAHHLADEANAGQPADRRFALRIGINDDHVIVDDLDVYGHGVNLAARLAQLAAPGETVVSAGVNAALVVGLDFATVDLGDCWLKHVERPVRAYRIGSERSSPTLLAAPSVALTPTLVILPFAARPGAPESLADVIVEELTAAFSGTSELNVISRWSSAPLAARGCKMQTLAELLGADYVLSGSYDVRHTDVTLRFELCATRDGRVLCASRARGPVESLCSLEAPLASEVAQAALRGVFDAEIRSARTEPLPHLAGYTMLMGGVALMHRFSPADFGRARQLIDGLVERWPRQAAPRAWSARWHLFRVLQGWSADAAADQSAARRDAEAAIELDPSSSVALSVAGSVRVGLDKDVEAGMTLYRRALTANPNDPLAWMLSGTAHAFVGRGQPATDSTRHAIRLSPLDPLRFLYECHAAGAALAAGRYVEARDLALRSNDANGQHLSTLRVLAIAQQLLDDGHAARATVARLLALDPHQSVSRFLRTAPSAPYPIGRLCAQALAAAGLPE